MIQQLLTEALNYDETADNILAILQEHNGKRLDKRIIDKIKLVAPNVYMNKTWSYTYIEWGGHRNSGGNKGGELTIADYVKNVIIDIKWIEERNKNYFAGKVNKNKEIQSLLNNMKLRKEMEETIQNYQDVKVNLDKMLDKFEVIKYKIIERYKLK